LLQGYILLVFIFIGATYITKFSVYFSFVSSFDFHSWITEGLLQLSQSRKTVSRSRFDPDTSENVTTWYNLLCKNVEMPRFFRWRRMRLAYTVGRLFIAIRTLRSSASSTQLTWKRKPQRTICTTNPGSMIPSLQPLLTSGGVRGK
jgi:hypothetical protein